MRSLRSFLLVRRAVPVLALMAACSLNAEDAFVPAKKFDGVATPIISTTIKFGYNDAFRGIITYVARPGEILRGAVYDTDNKVIQPADILILMETDYRKSAVEGKKAVLRSTIANLKNATDNYERYKKLIKTNATSMQSFQQCEADYYAAIGNKEAAETDLQLAEVMLRACTFPTPFDAVVDKVFFPSGLCAGELDVVRISQLTPMGIHVKMDRLTALKITNNTPVMVYPCNTDRPVGIMHGFGYLTEDGFMFKVDNAPLPPPVDLKDGDRTIPVCEISMIMPFQSDRGQRVEFLSVPVDSIFTDASGSYVWRGVGQRQMQPGKGLDHIFPVEKVYVEPEKLQHTINANVKCRLIRNNGKLAVYDSVLSKNIPEGLKNNDKVCTYRFRYMFMPGDPVRVQIGK